MKPMRWRKYTLPDAYTIGQLQLDQRGTATIAGKRFRPDEPILAVFDGGFRVVRPSGLGQFLVLERPYGIPVFFTFEGGVWIRWVRLYQMGQWRFYCHDVIRGWGIASPIIFARLGVFACALVLGLMMLFPLKWLVWVAASVAASLLIRFAIQVWRDRAARIAEEVLPLDPVQES